MVQSFIQLISVNLYINRYRYIESKRTCIQEDRGYDIQILGENKEEMIDLENDSMV